jgi:hypothetical protein
MGDKKKSPKKKLEFNKETVKDLSPKSKLKAGALAPTTDCGTTLDGGFNGPVIGTRGGTK